jgi:hypothetical protein
MINTSLNIGVLFEILVSILDKYLEIEFGDHIEVLFLIFQRTSIVVMAEIILHSHQHWTSISVLPNHEPY